MGIQNGKVTYIEQDISKTVVKLARGLATPDSAMITLFYGDKVSSQDAEKVRAMVEQKVGSGIEVAAINGGQPVYFYIISVE